MLRFHHYNHYFGALDASSPLLESRKRITLVIHFSPRCKVKIPKKAANYCSNINTEVYKKTATSEKVVVLFILFALWTGIREM